MEPALWGPRVTVLVVIGTMLVSGPAVPFVDLTPEAPGTVAEPDAATVRVVEPPNDDFRVAPARFGAGTYLYSPPMVVAVGEVAGSPRLVYELLVPELGQNIVTVAFLSNSHAGQQLTLELGRTAVRPESIERSSLAGAVRLRLRTGRETRVLYERNVTIRVERGSLEGSNG